jgi:HK97 family phage major capsid protein
LGAKPFFEFESSKEYTMSGTAQLDPKSIDERMNRLSELLDKAGNMAQARVNANGGSISYFEHEAEADSITGRQIKSATPMERLQRLPSEYVRENKKQFKSFSDFLRTGMLRPKDFETKYDGVKKNVMKSFGLNTYEGDAGASLVLPEFAPFIMEREYTNDIFSRTNNFSVSGNTMAFPRVNGNDRATGKRDGGLRGYWTGEENPILTSKPSFDNTTLKLKKLAVAVFVTEEMLEDNSYVLQQWVSRAVRREIDFMLGDACFRGNGVAQPLGFLNAPGTIAVPKVSGQANYTVIAENILEMWSRRVAGQPIDNLTWFVNQEVEAVLPKLVLGTGGNSALTFMPAGGMSGSPYATLMGRPIVPTEFNEGLGTVGDITLCDFGQMLSISKGGVQEAVSSEVEFLRDLLCYKFTIRVDAKPADDKVVTPYKGTATQSPFITLASRTP